MPPDVIHLHPLRRLALDAHSSLVRPDPVAMLSAERGAHVGLLAGRKDGLAVLGPQRRRHDAGAPHLPIDMRMVDLGLRRVGLGLLRVDDGPDRHVAHLLRQRPFQPAHLRAADDRPSRRVGHLHENAMLPTLIPMDFCPRVSLYLTISFSFSLDGRRRPLRPSRLPRKKEAPLAGRAAAILVIAFQSIAERCSNAAWNGVAKAA